MHRTSASARVEPQHPLVLGILEGTDSSVDLEDAVDRTLEAITRLPVKQSISAGRGDFYHPIYSRGLSRERPPYTYLRYDLKEQFYDKRTMLIEALWAGVPGLTSGSDTKTMTARPNFGTVPVPSVRAPAVRSGAHRPDPVVQPPARTRIGAANGAANGAA